MAKPRPVVAVMFGGRSSEHSISCLSASSVLAALDRARFEVLAIGVARDGRMYVQLTDPAMLEVNNEELPTIDCDGPRVMLSTDPTVRGFVAVDGDALPEAFSKVDVVFSTLHGPFGEDGTVQGALELAGIPTVGSGVFASAAAMDKSFMKAMFRAEGLPVGPYEVITDREWRTNPAEALARVSELGFPVFVKPARAGSSIGITKVKSVAGLQAAIEEARTHDPKVVVEAALTDFREIECSVLVRDGEPQVSVPAEIIVRGEHEFYDFNAKYLEDSAELIVPANLSDTERERVQSAALDAFRALGCEGYARCDFFLLANGRVLVNEVNTLPGFTDISMFPRTWLASGLTYPALVEALIADALQRGAGLR